MALKNIRLSKITYVLATNFKLFQKKQYVTSFGAVCFVSGFFCLYTFVNTGLG